MQPYSTAGEGFPEMAQIFFPLKVDIDNGIQRNFINFFYEMLQGTYSI